MARVVLIEFTADTFGEDGDLKREKGTRMYVDPISARSFVDKKKVAARVENGELVPRPRSVRKAKAVPEPEPESSLESANPEPTEGDTD